VLQPEDNIDLEGLEKFAKEFKRRRIELGIVVYVIVVVIVLIYSVTFDRPLLI